MIGGKKKKSRWSKGSGEKKNWWDKNSDSPWVGKYHILVKARIHGVKLEYFVVDLKQQMIVTKHPDFISSRIEFHSTAVLDKGTLSVLNIGINCKKTTYTSALDLTKTPPIWSDWTKSPKVNINRYLPYTVVRLDNNIFIFCRTRVHTYNEEQKEDAEVYQIGGSKWEKITIPSGCLKVKPIADPNNNRLIAYFDYLYAYNLNDDIEKWSLIHQQKLSTEDHYFLSQCHVVADQVVADNLILFYNGDEQIFTAHDISTNKWLTVYSKFDYKIDFNMRSQLFHLVNDILCLANYYHQYLPEGKKRSTVLKFLRFTVKLVKKEKEEDRVQLSPLSFHSIVMDNYIPKTFIPF